LNISQCDYIQKWKFAPSTGIVSRDEEKRFDTKKGNCKNIGLSQEQRPALSTLLRSSSFLEMSMIGLGCNNPMNGGELLIFDFLVKGE
jgi:hypothetical protein